MVDYRGDLCFGAGTPVLMADGSHRAIEEIKVGDLVLSKSESTGEVDPRKVVQTFVKEAPSTLVLTLGKEIVQTTNEHPFYVLGRGFVPAASIGIGNSIVTRAGPPVKLIASGKGFAARVYNFEVEEFHTYFVGSEALWVHNACSRLISLGNGVWQSTGGLVFGPAGSNSHGHRLTHVMAHLRANLARPIHSVFDVDFLIDILDEAWSPRTTFTRGQTKDVYDVNTGRVVGTAGETNIRIVTKKETSEVITAYPFL